MPTNLNSPGRPAFSMHSGMRADSPRYAPTLALDPEPWMDQALCDPATADEWFDNPAWAVTVCNQCPVKADCLERALKLEQDHIPWGVAGGKTAEERKALIREQRKASLIVVGVTPQSKCGTSAGSRQHYRDGEKPCPKCKAWNARTWRERRARERARA